MNSKNTAQAVIIKSPLAFIEEKVKQIKISTLFNFLAEKEGFEPSRPVKDLQAFQACPFSLLGISP